MTRPLAGVRVLDLTTALAGPLSTLRLRDLGADVYKIEGPNSPDSTRNMVIGGVPIGETTSSFVALNRDKKTLSLDLKNPSGRDVFETLVRASDLLVTNYLPGTVRKLGMTRDVLHALNPKLTAVYISGFAAFDTRAEEAGIDLLLQAYSGLMLTGGSLAQPYTASPVFAVDVATSHLATEAALTGLYNAARKGRGLSFDISMMTAALELQLQEFSTFATTGHMRQKGQEEAISVYMDPPYGVLETSDGMIAVARSRLDLLEKALEMPELQDLAAAKPAEVEKDACAMWRDTVFRKVRAEVKSLTSQNALERLGRYDIWSVPVRSYEDLVREAGVLRRIVEVPLDNGVFKTLGGTIGDNAAQAGPHFVSAFGEDTRAVLRDFGYGEHSIDALLDVGAVSERSPVPDLQTIQRRRAV